MRIYVSANISDNEEIRISQARDAIRFIDESDADLKLFGADINTTPDTEPYELLTAVMKGSYGGLLQNKICFETHL